MTYFQLMNKALEYYVCEDLNQDFFDYWNIKIFDEKGIKEIKENAKKEKIYLFLKEFSKSCKLDEQHYILLKTLAYDLTDFNDGIDELLKNAVKFAKEKTNEDFFYTDIRMIIEDKTSRNNYSKEQIEKLKKSLLTKELEEIENYLKEEAKDYVLNTPEENIIFDVITILPELFFTKQGYNYIEKDYQITNDDLRNKCYWYVKTSIKNLSEKSEYCYLDDYASLSYVTELIDSVIELSKNTNLTYLDTLLKIDQTNKDKNKLVISMNNQPKKVNTFDLTKQVFNSVNNESATYQINSNAKQKLKKINDYQDNNKI